MLVILSSFSGKQNVESGIRASFLAESSQTNKARSSSGRVGYRKIAREHDGVREPTEMNLPKADELDYIHFLIAAQKIFTCTEAARCQPNHLDPPAHDAFTRLLSREPPDTEALWEEAKTLVAPEHGLLVVWTTPLWTSPTPER